MADSSEHDETPRETSVQPPQKGPRSLKSWVILALKVGVSTFGLYKVWQAVIAKDGFDEIAGHLGRLHWGWFAAAVAMQLFAIGCAVVRWRVMLGGQGVRGAWSFLFPSFMIGRFWGAFTPGGLGLDGWKLFDVGYHTKKYARAIAVTAVEKVLGQLAFGIVVMLSSAWGFAFIGTEGVILVNVFFLVLVGAGMTLLARPALFRLMGRMLPRQVQPRLQTLIDAVCAYHGKGMLLAQAVALGVGVHAFNNLIYVCAARALGIDLSMQLVFFASSMQIMATLVPISVNGVGLREAAAVALYATVGLSEAQAVLIPTVGFGAEMLVSLTGVLFLFARRIGGEVRGLSVEDADREDKFYAELPAIPEAEWPRRLRGLTVGASAGLVAGMIVGVAEGAVVVADGGGRVGFGVMAYGAVAYGVFCALGGAAFGLASAWVGRLMQREAVPEPQAFGRLAALMVAAIGFGLAAFRIRRDVFHEEIGWKSKEMLLVAAGCALAAAAIYFGLSFALRAWSSRRAGAFLLRAWGSPALVAVVLAGVLGVATALPPTYASDASRGAAPDGAPNVLVIVVDTLRADHLPAYGYEGGRTPNLDRFAEDAVRYEQAFANASWTRPSFASILTGRYASSHGVMGKPDSLPDDAVTLPEALREGGYETAGFVTNFNVGPYFNFQQGFDEYAFLEPEFVLGADDSAAKLLLVQFLRQRIEQLRAAGGAVEPGTAYQDAETVNRHLVSWLERGRRQRPFFLFVGYMDPHDPYFPHPYDGTGYARAAHQRPDPSEAPRLRELYDGEITYWDEHFGRLMDELRRRGLYDDMMIVVTSDHGEEFAEHGGFWHGTTLYDEQLHVPLFVKYPRGERGGTSEARWVQSVDIMPSVLAAAGLSAVAGVQGHVFEQSAAVVFAEESHEGNVLTSVRERRESGAFKIITANEGNPRGLAAVELYAVDDDPGEQANVADSRADDLRGITVTLEEARRLAAEGRLESGSVDMDEDTRRQLCALGYIEAGECCREGLLPPAQCRGT